MGPITQVRLSRRRLTDRKSPSVQRTLKDDTILVSAERKGRLARSRQSLWPHRDHDGWRNRIHCPVLNGPRGIHGAIGVRGPYFKAMRTIAQISKFLRASTGVDGSTV